MRTRLVTLLICATAILSACGGGGSDSSPTPAPTPQSPSAPPVPSGRYSVATIPGYLLSSGEQALYVERERMGSATWDRSSMSAALTMQMLAFAIDDLGNETPSAKASTVTMSIAQNQLSLAPQSAPPIVSIPRTWEFANLYRFGSDFVDYTAQIDIDSAGVLTGFDTNGCNFLGELKSRTDGVAMYDARIVATNCGNTARFISDGEYQGHAFIDVGGHMLILTANPAQKLGLYFQLAQRAAVAQDMTTPSNPCDLPTSCR